MKQTTRKTFLKSVAGLVGFGVGGFLTPKESAASFESVISNYSLNVVSNNYTGISHKHLKNSIDRYIAVYKKVPLALSFAANEGRKTKKLIIESHKGLWLILNRDSYHYPSVCTVQTQYMEHPFLPNDTWILSGKKGILTFKGIRT